VHEFGNVFTDGLLGFSSFEWHGLIILFWLGVGKFWFYATSTVIAEVCGVYNKLFTQKRSKLKEGDLAVVLTVLGHWWVGHCCFVGTWLILQFGYPQVWHPIAVRGLGS